MPGGCRAGWNRWCPTSSSRVKSTCQNPGQMRKKRPDLRLFGVVHLGALVDGCRDALHARFELQGQVVRVVARQGEVAAVEPQALLSRRLPHVAQLALPR